MATVDVIEEVAQGVDLDPEDVERVLELTADLIQTAAEQHETVELATGSGKTHVLLVLMMALADAEAKGTVDEPTLSALRAIRNLIVHGQTVERLVESMLPEQIVVPTPAAVLQARRNAQARN